MLFIGTVCIGIGNGMVEAACNPLVVSLYPDNKTTMLNRFHVWFPGGIVIGGLICLFITEQLNLDWRIMIAILFLPLLYMVGCFLNSNFLKLKELKRSIRQKKCSKLV